MPRPDIREIAGRLRALARLLRRGDVLDASQLAGGTDLIADDLDAALEGATVLVRHLEHRCDVDHLLVVIPLEDDHAD